MSIPCWRQASQIVVPSGRLDLLAVDRELDGPAERLELDKGGHAGALRSNRCKPFHGATPPRCRRSAPGRRSTRPASPGRSRPAAPARRRLRREPARPSRCSASSWRTVPTRHGTHCPQDSSRKNAAIRRMHAEHVHRVVEHHDDARSRASRSAARAPSNVSGMSSSSARTNDARRAAEQDRLQRPPAGDAAGHVDQLAQRGAERHLVHAGPRRRSRRGRTAASRSSAPVPIRGVGRARRSAGSRAR